MIAKTDLFILVVSASLLAVGIYRWQHNLSLISANAQQAKIYQVIPASNATVVSAISASNAVAAQTTISSVSSVQTSIPVVTSNSPSTDNGIVNSASESATGSVISNTIENDRPLFGSYLVVSGDVLSRIAVRFGTTVQRLEDINNIDGALIEIDQEILYPLPAN